MPEREFFKFGDEVEEVSGFTSSVRFTYVGPIGMDGEHILFDPADNKAYRTFNIGGFRRPHPRKGELWARNAAADSGRTVTSQPVLVVHADEHFVIFTTTYHAVANGSLLPTTNIFSAKKTSSFTAARKRVEDA